jgi:hypothetical protein
MRILCPTEEIYNMVESYLVNIGFRWRSGMKHIPYSCTYPGECKIHVAAKGLLYGRSRPASTDALSFEEFMELFLPFLDNYKTDQTQEFLEKFGAENE